ncbi:MAG: hypothetical protein JWR45_2000 [Blastococcus sp.]|jgi:hypothetical protein|nr:hypothetical protein [Blastococcus sp.]
MFDQNETDPVRPVKSTGHRVHPTMPRHRAIPDGATGGSRGRSLLIAVVVLALVGLLVYALLS